MATGFSRVVELQNGKPDPLTDAAAALFAHSQDDKMTSEIFFMAFISKKLYVLGSLIHHFLINKAISLGRYPSFASCSREVTCRRIFI